MWTPPAEALAQIVNMLAFTQSHDNAVQRQAVALLDSLRPDPLFVVYLVHILAHGTHLDANVRAVAGLTMKNQLSASYSRLPAEMQTRLKADIVYVLNDVDKLLRRTAANLIASIVRSEGLLRWPTLPSALVTLMDSGSPHAVAGSLLTTRQLAEDVAEELDDDALGNPLDNLVPRLIALMGHADVNIQLLAAESMRDLMYTGARATVTHLGAYFTALVALSSLTAVSIRIIVSSSLSTLMNTRIAVIWPHLSQIITHQLAASADADAGVARTALQFWRELAAVLKPQLSTHPKVTDVLDAHLPMLVPLLLRLLIMNDAAYAKCIADSRKPDATVPDRLQDVAPRFAVHAAADADGATAQSEDVSDDDDDDTEGREDGDMFKRRDGDELTVRAAAGRALEDLADIAPHKVFPIAFPVILAQLRGEAGGPDVLRGREAGLLGLGAIYSGCSTELASSMDQLFPYLLQCALDTLPDVRSAAVWALEQMSSWMLEQTLILQEVGETEQLPVTQYLQVLLRLLFDDFKDVQKQALSAALEVVSVCGEDLDMALATQLLSAFMQALPRYQLRNRLLLLDCTTALLVNKTDVGADERLAPLAAWLMDKYAALPDDHPEFLAILETTSTAVQCDGLRYLAAHVGALCSRCIRIMEHELVICIASSESLERTGGENVELLTAAVDFVDAILEATGDGFAEILTKSNLLHLLLQIIQHGRGEARRAAIAAVGDLVCRLFTAIAPAASAVFDVIQNQMSFPSQDVPVSAVQSSAVGNAVWVMSELLPRLGAAAVAPQAGNIMQRLLLIMTRKIFARGAMLNGALCLARMMAMFPAAVVPHMGTLVTPWGRGATLNGADAKNDLHETYSGWCQAIAAAPAACAPHAADVMVIMAHYVHSMRDLPPPPLLEQFRRAALAVKSSTPPADFVRAVAALQPVAKSAMQQIVPGLL